MLDVLHYYMEEDFKVPSSEVADARDKARAIIYKSLYNQEYKFGTTSKTQTSPTAMGFEEDIVPVDPTTGPTKSYFPPTDFNEQAVKPFGDVLDAPFEH